MSDKDSLVDTKTALLLSKGFRSAEGSTTGHVLATALATYLQVRFRVVACEYSPSC